MHSFFTELCTEYELSLNSLESAKNIAKNTENNIILLNQESEEQIEFVQNLENDYLIFASIKNLKINLNKNSKLLITPISIEKIKNIVKKFVENLKVNFHDIIITNERLTNKNNNLACYLTNIEKEILVCLIREKEITKNFVKKNILNIKSNIETNSLESHLTRIRKKIQKINSTAKIYSKNEKLLISN